MESLCSLLQQAALNMCVCLKLPSENMKCIWMQCDKKMFGLEEAVMVGAAYINPQSRDFPVCAIQTHFTDLFEDTLGAFQVSPNVTVW